MKGILVFLFSIILLSTIVACGAEEGSTEETIPQAGNGIFLKDQEGNVLASIDDFVSGSAEMVYEQGIRMQAIEFQFKDASKLEEITNSHLHSQVHFYFGEDRLASPVISNVITDGNVVIDGGFSVELAEELVEEINR